MATKYICSRFKKERIEDVLDVGVDGKRDILDIQNVRVVTDTLSGLFAKLGREHDIEIKEVTPAVDRPGIWDFFRDETEDGEPADEAYLAMWKAGEKKLYYTRYSFTISKMSDVTEEEIEAAGIVVDG